MDMLKTQSAPVATASFAHYAAMNELLEKRQRLFLQIKNCVEAGIDVPDSVATAYHQARRAVEVLFSGDPEPCPTRNAMKVKVDRRRKPPRRATNPDGTVTVWSLMKGKL